MKKKFLFIVLSISAAVVLFSCKTVSSADGLELSAHPKVVNYNEKKFNSEFNKGNFSKCAGMLLSQSIGENNIIKQNLDIALLEHFAGYYKASSEIMNKTDRLMDEAVTKSITKSVASATLNENASEYAGTPYEYIFINVFNALNYYNDGNMEDALVEIRKINNKQKEYSAKYGEVALKKESIDSKEIIDADIAASFFGVNVAALKLKSPSAPTENDVFKDSETARYLSMIFMKMSGDEGNARVDYDILKKMNPSFNAYVSSDDRKGNVSFLTFSNLIGKRYEQNIYFPGDVLSGIFTVNYSIVGYGESAMIMLPPLSDNIQIPAFRIKFSYPAFDKSCIEKKVNTVRVLCDETGEVINLEKLEDFNDAVAKDVKVKGSKAFSRSVVRSLTKKMAAITAGTATLTTAVEAFDGVRKNGSFGEEVLYRLAYASAYASVVAAIEAVDVSETADLRQCNYLPGESNAGSFNLAPGVYSFTVDYLDVNNRVVKEDKIKPMEVRAGQTVLVESECVN